MGRVSREATKDLSVENRGGYPKPEVGADKELFMTLPEDDLGHLGVSIKVAEK